MVSIRRVIEQIKVELARVFIFVLVMSPHPYITFYCHTRLRCLTA